MDKIVKKSWEGSQLFKPKPKITSWNTTMRPVSVSQNGELLETYIIITYLTLHGNFSYYKKYPQQLLQHVPIAMISKFVKESNHAVG